MAELDGGRAADAAIKMGSDATGAAVVTVSGDLDISNADALEATVTSITATRPERLIFDLSGLRFIDSAGITVLLGAAAKVKDVRLRKPSPAVRRVVELTGLAEVLPIES
jgi:anti-sigma B factor antagonist